LSGDKQKLLTDYVYDTYNDSPKYKKGGEITDYDFDYMDIGQFSVPDSDWRKYSQEDFLKMGKKIVDEQFDGDLGRAYDKIVHKKMEQGGNIGNVASEFTPQDYTNRELKIIASDYAYATSGDLDRATYRLLDPEFTNILLPRYIKEIRNWEETNNKPINPKKGFYAKGGYLPNGLVKSVDTTSGKRIFNKDIIDGVYPSGDLKVPANNRYSKIAKNLDSDKNLTEQANYLPKRRIKSVNTTFGKRLYPNDIKDGMYIKAGVKFATGGAVRKSGNEAKYQRQVDEVNRLISLAYDSDGDPIAVFDSSSTYEMPYVYKPVKYSNGVLYLEYMEYAGRDFGKIKKDKVKKSDMFFDNPLLEIAKMYRKALKKEKINFK
jgi:hypothetical protein